MCEFYIMKQNKSIWMILLKTINHICFEGEKLHSRIETN